MKLTSHSIIQRSKHGLKDHKLLKFKTIIIKNHIFAKLFFYI